MVFLDFGTPSYPLLFGVFLLVSLTPHPTTMCKIPWPLLHHHQPNTLVVYQMIHKKFPESMFGKKWIEQDFLNGCASRKFPGATEHLKRYSWFSGWNGPKFVFSFFKAIFDTNFRLSWPFFSDSRTKFNRTELCLPFTQTMKGPVCPFWWL